MDAGKPFVDHQSNSTAIAADISHSDMMSFPDAQDVALHQAAEDAESRSSPNSARLPSSACSTDYNALNSSAEHLRDLPAATSTSQGELTRRPRTTTIISTPFEQAIHEDSCASSLEGSFSNDGSSALVEEEQSRATSCKAALSISLSQDNQCRSLPSTPARLSELPSQLVGPATERESVESITSEPVLLGQ